MFSVHILHPSAHVSRVTNKYLASHESTDGDGHLSKLHLAQQHQQHQRVCYKHRVSHIIVGRVQSQRRDYAHK